MKKLNDNCRKKVITLKDIFYILVKTKLWFTITFLVVFTAGLIFTFIRPTIYSVEASIRLSDNYKYYNDFLLENFPNISENLWLYEESKIKENESKIIDVIDNEIGSSEFMGELKSLLSFDIDFDELEKSIYSYRKQDKILTIKTVYNNEQKTYEILEKSVDLLKNSKRAELDIAYNKLVEEIDKKIEIFSGQEINYKESEQKESEIVYNNSFYNDLIIARGNLLENKDYFTNRIELVKELNILDVYQYTSKKRDSIISLSLGVFLGLIVSFSKFFLSLKNKTFLEHEEFFT